MGMFKNMLGEVVKAVKTALTRTGVKIGGTASYPRVEIHSWTESGPMDKGNNLRSISLTIECLSQQKIADIMDLQAGNAERLVAEAMDLGTGATVVGIVPGQTRFLEEVADSANIIYRLQEDITVFVSKE